MAHIPDGILSAPVLIAGAVVTAGGVALALRSMDERAIPRAAILAAVFFAGSLVSVPMGPASVHLLFTGVMGVLLGTGAFAAVLTALMLQVLLFGVGGLTTLGINTLNIALPAVVAGAIFGPLIRSTARPSRASGYAACAAVLAVAGTAGLVALSLWLSDPAYTPAARVMALTYLPLALAEAAVSASVVGFIKRVQPDALAPRAQAAHPVVTP
ncbi:Fused nickel transport protein NikMN [Aquimixticola soesokkakensis]|uniref:Fused nickel transport protein NikMN n=1 Tax=Aquimixticola soesokkakensis TaxID=1519096 RepID=A0A1Y5RKS8_9RHOB|nr:cobalt transporter CbiM [Aquimixticola soesokkakensis]SLN19822.1 Fused nickel transport protein NikMN [Aquimixticola soesokkakensis]